MNILVLSRSKNLNEIVRELALFGKLTIAETIEEIPFSITYDFAISYCFGPILKTTHIEQLNCKILNAHPSLLPFGRGIYPILWSAALGNPQGSTIHLIENDGIDNGKVILQQEVAFEPSTTLAQAHTTLLSLSRSLLYISIASRLINEPNSLFDLPDQSIAKDNYRSRKQGEEFLKYLPDHWNTSLGEVCKIYKSLQ